MSVNNTVAKTVSKSGVGNVDADELLDLAQDGRLFLHGRKRLATAREQPHGGVRQKGGEVGQRSLVPLPRQQERGRGDRRHGRSHVGLPPDELQLERDVGGDGLPGQESPVGRRVTLEDFASSPRLHLFVHPTVHVVRIAAPWVVGRLGGPGRRVPPEERMHALGHRRGQQHVGRTALRLPAQDRAIRSHRIHDRKAVGYPRLEVRRLHIPAGRTRSPAVVQDQTGEAGEPQEPRRPVGDLPDDVDVVVLFGLPDDVDRPIADREVRDVCPVGGLDVADVAELLHPFTTRYRRQWFREGC